MADIKLNMDSLKTRKDVKRHKIGEGSNIFRILPPFGDESVHNNYAYRKWSVAWLIDPNTGKKRPFATPATEGKPCPVTEYNVALTAKIKDMESALSAEGMSKDEIKKELEGIRKVQWEHKVAHSYAYNAASQDGQIGILEIKSTAHKQLKKAMNEYISDYGQDPTTLGSDINENAGVWFNFTKEGSGMDTEYGVTIHQTKKKTADGIVKVDDRTPLSPNIVENYSKQGYDLSTLYVKKSYSDLKDILDFNIELVSKEVPEAVLEEKAEKAAAAAPAPKAKAKVSLRVDDEDDMDDEEVAPKKAAPLKVKNSTLDVMAMANELLGE